MTIDGSYRSLFSVAVVLFFLASSFGGICVSSFSLSPPLYSPSDRWQGLHTPFSSPYPCPCPCPCPYPYRCPYVTVMAARTSLRKDMEDQSSSNEFYDEEEHEQEHSTDTNSYIEDDDDWDVEDDGDRDGDSQQDSYWEDKEAANAKGQRRGGVYKVKFDAADAMDPKQTELYWELCSDQDNDALVLLPPEAVEKPTAVLHFVGGTFFGSLPKVWYRSFLEGLVRNTQCAVIVTPIPVTLLKSPLQHISLAKKLRSSFENAWISVLEDEYGDLSDTPLCGIGHSLGSRLMVVMTTLTQNRVTNKSIPAFKSFVLLSFTNYGASAGIPGISTLLRQNKRQERSLQLKREEAIRKKARGARQDWWTDDGFTEDEDEEWEELTDELQQLFKEQTDKVRQALTPDSKDLEFFPTPDALWKAVKEDGRYSVPHTLLVQFDDDAIDQSSKLAQVLLDTNSSDVYFARLRGVHLTPVSVDEGSEDGWLGLSSQASKAIWKSVKGRDKTKAQESAMRDLRQSICSYILDVVTK